MLARLAALTVLITMVALPCSMIFGKSSYQKNRRSDTPLFRFEQNNKAGYIDAHGKIVIPPTLDIGWFAEEDFVEGLSPARKGENWGFIDVKGNWAVNPQYWRVEPFSEGLAAVTLPVDTNFATAYIDKSGQTVISLPDRVTESGPFSEGLAAVRSVGYTSEGKVGYIDRSGKLVIPYQFASGGAFHEGLAAVVLDGKCYVEDYDGGARGTPPSVPAATSCGGVPSGIAKKCEEGFIDRTGKVVFSFDGIRGFSEGLAAVEKSGKWGFIAPSGNLQIEPQFEAARSFSGGLAAVRIAGRWGYIDRTGRVTIRAKYSKADDFSDSAALTDQGYIDRLGNAIASPQGATPFVQGLAHVMLGENEFGYMNHAGKIVFRYRAEPTKPSMLPYSDR